MSPCLHIVGLGPSGLEQLTLGNYRLICGAEKVFARTAEHPCVQELIAEGICVESFDDLYTAKPSFEVVYESIVEQLREELNKSSEVIYMVPGHPMVAEKTVQLIFDKLALQNTIIIHPALSFIDEIFRALKFDPIDGVIIRNYDALTDGGLTGNEWLIIPQVHNKILASEVKLDLMRIYPDDAWVYIIKALGTPGEQVDKLPLFELDHGTCDHLTTIVLPPNSDVISFSRLTKIMRTLRSKEGCPWDLKQTHDTLKPYLIEESYEVLNAIEKNDMHNLCEELGDLLLQVVFHAQVASDAKEFAIDDVLQGIIQKMIRRHPHVFGAEKAETADDVNITWQRIKQEEKKDKNLESSFFKDPIGLPALMWASSTQRRAAEAGFDWSDMDGPWGKVKEELQELKSALAEGVGKREELGDLLFSIVNLSRFLKLDAEDALRDSIHKFQRRFQKMVDLAQKDSFKLEQLALNEMDLYWEKAKSIEKI